MTIIGALRAAKAGEKVRKTAPFYSAVDEALANLKRPKGTGIEFLTEVLKQPGVKKAEIADRKLEQAFKAKGKMTKEEAQQVLKDNPPPNLKEKVYDESTAIDEEDLREMVSQEMFDKPYSSISFGSAQHRKISDEVYKRMEADNGTKFGKFKTEGGENYREILLKLPKTRPNASNYTDPAKYDADMRAYNASGQSDYYHPNHFSDDANIVAHMRVQDRLIPQPPQKGFYVVNKTSGRQSAMFDTPEELQAYVETLPESIRNNVTMAQGERKVPPKKVLQIEEIQSDWHQEGRKKGYGKQELEPLSLEEDQELMRLYNMGRDNRTAEESSRMRQLNDRLNSMQGKPVGVPDAPFKKNWHELAMKRLLNYAADNGYDSIAITPGAEQANRYKLSSHIDNMMVSETNQGTRQISWRPKGERVDSALQFDKNGNVVQSMLSDLKGKNISNIFGKDLSEKIMQAKPFERFEGVDLDVGGEGMMGFYDKIIPDYLNTFGKPYGAQVGLQTIDVPKMINVGSGAQAEVGRLQMPMHSFPITPEMRQQIQQKGLPLYQQVGIPTAGAGAASQMLEPEEEAGLAGGGSVAKLAALAKLKKMREEMTPRAEAVKNIIARDENSYLRDVAPNSLTNESIEQEIARMKARAEASKPEVKEAKGGKVRMTNNRDAMFMELSNKKLKRK